MDLLCRRSLQRFSPHILPQTAPHHLLHVNLPSFDQTLNYENPGKFFSSTTWYNQAHYPRTFFGEI